MRFVILDGQGNVVNTINATMQYVETHFPGLWQALIDDAPERIGLVQRKVFFQRFTAAEREALENIKATGTQAQKNKLNAFINYLLMDELVDLTDPYIISSVTLMEAANVIAAGRASEILAY